MPRGSLLEIVHVRRRCATYAARRLRQESNEMTTNLITGKTPAKGASQFEVDMKYGQMRVWKLEREGDALQ